MEQSLPLKFFIGIVENNNSVFVIVVDITNSCSV